jgi:hypothetical protein
VRYNGFLLTCAVLFVVYFWCVILREFLQGDKMIYLFLCAVINAQGVCSEPEFVPYKTVEICMTKRAEAEATGKYKQVQCRMTQAGTLPKFDFPRNEAKDWQGGYLGE